MATFKVGQRVRIVLAQAYPYLVGLETTIAEVLDYSQRVYRLVGITPLAKPEHIEPIIDDGRKSVPWTECLWQPTPERETA